MLSVDIMTDVEQDDSAVAEVSRFMQQPNIAVTQCPLAWWCDHGDDYARIREVMRRYLVAPSPSVASKRLFSSGELFCDSHTHMAPEKAQMLLFVKYYVNHFL
jgi:hAT family C-terminal dimerisation region